jgi:hypothetical protein
MAGTGTAGSGGDPGSPAPGRVAVCVVRLVVQESGPLYTVTVNPDVLARVAERSHHTGSGQEVLRLVREFVTAFEAGS